MPESNLNEVENIILALYIVVCYINHRQIWEN